MPTSIEAITRTRMKTIADTVTGLTSTRNKLGLVDAPPASFLKNIVTGGPYLLILPAAMSGIDDMRKVQFEIVSHLWFGFAGDADYTFTAIEDIVFNLRNKWLDSTLFTDSPTPDQMSIPAPEKRTDLKPVVGVYKITASFTGC